MCVEDEFREKQGLKYRQIQMQTYSLVVTKTYYYIMWFIKNKLLDILHKDRDDEYIHNETCTQTHPHPEYVLSTPPVYQQ